MALVHLGLGLLLLSLAPRIAGRPVESLIAVAVPDARKPADDPAPAEAPEPVLDPVRPDIAAPEIETAPPEPVPAPPPPVQPEPAPSPTPALPAAAPPARPPRVFGPPDLRPRGAADPFADSERVGTAPGGEPLYAARWVREPLDSELRGFLSTATGPGWGLIACRTAPGNRVEDCVMLDESPPGSRIARAVQAAAWQFLVHPPRVGGKPQIGEWVRIRIDYGLKPDGRAR
ncbi:MAG: hypothetical protein ACK4Z0_05000 [Sphingomonadaceae bacterium]